MEGKGFDESSDRASSASNSHEKQEMETTWVLIARKRSRRPISAYEWK